MLKKQWMPLIIAAVLSTLLIIVLLALGITAISFANIFSVFAVLGGFSIAVIASENIALHSRMMLAQPWDACGTRRLHWHHRIAIWLGVLLMLYVLLMINFIEAGVLTLGLIALWIPAFLVIALIIELL